MPLRGLSLRRPLGFVAIVAAGVLVWGLVGVMRRPEHDPVWPLMFLAGGALLAGLLALRVPHALLARRWGELPDDEVIGGSVFLFAGVSLLAIGFVDDRAAHFPMRRVLVALPGVMFATGGVAILQGAVARNSGRPSAAGPLLVALLVSLFAAVMTVLAFGPVLSGTERYPGCIALPGAVFLVGLAGWLWREVWRSRKRARPEPRD